jgi:hypothetical protein
MLTFNEESKKHIYSHMLQIMGRKSKLKKVDNELYKIAYQEAFLRQKNNDFMLTHDVQRRNRETRE